MKKFSDYRKIKATSLSINPNDTIIHPNTLKIYRNDNNFNVVASQFFIQDDTLGVLEESKKTLNITKEEYVRNMAIPNLALPLTDLLNIYNIDNYDELIYVIKKKLNSNEPKYTIYRIVNLYVKLFFNDLKNINKTLIRILSIVFSDFKLDDKIYIEFLNNWFKKHNEEEFDLNICRDFKNFLSNEYGHTTKSSRR
jgi:hypothetical protein